MSKEGQILVILPGCEKWRIKANKIEQNKRKAILTFKQQSGGY